MFDKDNFLNSIAYLTEETFKNAITNQLINIPDANIVVQRTPLNISSIASSNDYYILLLYQRSSKLAYFAETINERKRRKYRIEIFCVAQTDSLCTRLAGSVTEFVDSNQHLFAQFGLRKAEAMEFLKVADSKIFNTTTMTDNFSAYAGTLEGEIVL